MNAARGFGAVGALLVLSGCGGEAAAGPEAAVVRDSAGISIVESSEPSWTADTAWRLSPTPRLMIGEADGAQEYLFSGLADVRVMDDGMVVVANRNTGELRLYNAEGRHLRSLGRSGEGPGEFSYLTWIRVLSGDTVVAYDGRLRRVQRFHPTTGFAGSHDFRDQLQLAGMLADGTVLGRKPVGEMEAVTEGVHRMPVSNTLFSPSGDSLRIVATHRSAAEVWTSAGEIALSMGVIFGNAGVAAVGPDAVYLGDNERYEIGVYSPAGELERIIRRSGDLRPLPPGVVDSIREAALSRNLAPPVKTAYERIFQLMPIPERLPAYRKFLPDDAGNLWVEEYPLPGQDSVRWTIFDPNGRMLGEIPFPGAFEPKHIGADFIAGVHRDEMQVERVEIYSLEKP